MQIYYCDSCGARVSEENLRSGGAVIVEDSVFCASCAGEISGLETIQALTDDDVVVEDADLGLNDTATIDTPRSRPLTPSSRRRRHAQRPQGPPAVLFVGLGGGALLLFVVVLAYLAFRPAAGPAIGQPEVVIAVPETAPIPKPVPEKAPPKEPETAVPERRPLGEGLRTPEITPVKQPEPPKPPPPTPKPEPPRPEKPPQPLPPGEWIEVFNGQNLDGWRRISGKVTVENGALVITDDADVFYRAEWEEFDFSCEIRGERIPGAPEGIFGIMLGQSDPGRGNYRAIVYFHSDGDAHVRAKGLSGTVFRSGGGKFPLNDWLPIRLELRRDALKLYSNNDLVGTVSLAGATPQRGGLYFYANSKNVGRYRAVRVQMR